MFLNYEHFNISFYYFLYFDLKWAFPCQKIPTTFLKEIVKNECTWCEVLVCHRWLSPVTATDSAASILSSQDKVNSVGIEVFRRKFSKKVFPFILLWLICLGCVFWPCAKLRQSQFWGKYKPWSGCGGPINWSANRQSSRGITQAEYSTWVLLLFLNIHIQYFFVVML